MATAPSINTSEIQTHNYADDTFYISAANTPEETWTQLKPHLNKFLQWCSQYRLKIQSHKTTNTFFTRRCNTPDSTYPQIVIQNTPIPRQNQITILGATLDTRMTLRQHIKRITANSLYTINKLRAIFKTHPQIPPRIAILLYNTLLRTRFTYAAPLLTIIKPSTWRTLEHIEHRALRAAHRKGIRTRITKLYQLSNIQPIQEHYKTVSKNTLIRTINNKNHRLLKTVVGNAWPAGHFKKCKKVSSSYSCGKMGKSRRRTRAKTCAPSIPLFDDVNGPRSSWQATLNGLLSQVGCPPLGYIVHGKPKTSFSQ